MKLIIFLIISIPFFVALYLLFTNCKKMIKDRDAALEKRNSISKKDNLS
ncbi:hypothetical protein [Clostridium thermobutyricum]|nr:hypothetical protein [Clostridium thermobutyricum]